jgi:hypothetical protein
MAFGKKTQDLNYDKPAAEALADLEKALRRIGKVKSVDPDKMTISGRTKFGLQTVKIEASVADVESGSIISLIGKSDDARGVGAQNGLERLVETMGHVDDLDFEVSETGMERPSWMLWGYVILGGAGLLALGLILMSNPEMITGNSFVVALIVALYLWGFRRVFKKK